MAKPKEPQPDHFHCYNTFSTAWMHGRVIDGVLYLSTISVYERYNQIVQSRVPNTCPVANPATWREVGREELARIALYGVTTGYRNADAENALAKAYAARPVKPVKVQPANFNAPGIWMQPTGVASPIQLDAGFYSVLVHEGNTSYVVSEHKGKPLREDPLASEIEAYPAYWRPLPAHWKAMDFYRVRELFPLPAGFESARLDHALKKLLIPGNRTGGKSVYKDLKEAHATLGQWLREHADLEG